MITATESQNKAFAEDASRKTWPAWAWITIALGALLVLGVLFWQGITAQGNPDPLKAGTSSMAAIMNIGVLVFREGLECILVLSAITASMVGAQKSHRKPVAIGAGFGFIATVVTWFIAIGILNSLSDSVSALNLQAITGLIAVIVLLVVMNWFFHKMYWGGWICLHNRKKKELVKEASAELITPGRLLLGLGLLGFSSFYREGFEVVLFLQGYRLQLGTNTVMLGTLIGGALTAIVAALTFVAHRRLPYRKMLILTGVMLGAVLLVMVGEQVQEMQLAHWIPTTEIAGLVKFMPDWMGLWFGVIPTVQTLAAQGFAAALVIGSYIFAGRGSTKTPECSAAGSGTCAEPCK